MNERHTKILQLLGKGNIVSVKELSDTLKVSSVTIRQDLNFLESEALLSRVHGGALINDSDDIAHRMGIHYKQKFLIARKAADFINEGDTILIESGSVNAILARELHKFKDLTVITTNVYIAQQLRKSNHLNIVIPGGMYQHESESLVGTLTKIGIDEVNFSKAFIGVDGFTLESGFTSRDMHRAEISSHIIGKCRTSFVLTDSSKFGHAELSKICDAGAIDFIITDKSAPKEINEFFNNLKVTFIRV